MEVKVYYRSSDIPTISGESEFHSKELFMIYEETHGFTPYFFTVTDGDKCILHLVAAVRRDKPIFPQWLFRRCVIYGCGKFDADNNNKEQAFELLLGYLSKEVIRSSFLIEFRDLEDPKFGYRSFTKNHYFPINWLKVHNSLHGDITVEQRLSSSRLRQIKKGLRNGAIVEEAQSDDDVMEFSRMLRHVYSSHIRKYFPDKAFFHHLYKKWHESGKTKIFIVRYKDKIIGGSVCLYSGNNAYLWFSGGMRKTYALQYPGVLAVWKAIEDARQCGYWHFEFMDVGLPFKKHGFREFVLRFGGKQSSTRRWYRFRWRWLNKICIKLYR